jgi:hypothetical protein
MAWISASWQYIQSTPLVVGGGEAFRGEGSSLGLSPRATVTRVARP